MIQVVDANARSELANLLATAMSDEREAFELAPDGSWSRRVSTPEVPLTDLQQALLQQVIQG
jgi:polyphosphate kinase